MARRHLRAAERDEDVPAAQASGVGRAARLLAAGLRGGDIIVALDGKKMATVNQLVVAIRSRDAGDTVRVTVQRGGQPVDITLQLQSST